MYIFNTGSKPNWPWISLLLPGNNMENTWNFVSQEKWEPWMQVSGISATTDEESGTFIAC